MFSHPVKLWQVKVWGWKRQEPTERDDAMLQQSLEHFQRWTHSPRTEAGLRSLCLLSLSLSQHAPNPDAHSWISLALSRIHNHSCFVLSLEVLLNILSRGLAFARAEFKSKPLSQAALGAKAAFRSFLAALFPRPLVMLISSVC